MAIDKIAEELNVKFNKKGCSAEYGFTSVNGEMIVLAKPQTYMNLSGEAVKSLMGYFKEEAKNVLIIFVFTPMCNNSNSCLYLNTC